MYPMLCKMADQQKDVTFVKLNCNKYNKELGKQLGALTDTTRRMRCNAWQREFGVADPLPCRQLQS
jgi:hypothetical protein